MSRRVRGGCRTGGLWINGWLSGDRVVCVRACVCDSCMPSFCCRNKRMLGMLLGTLQQFRVDQQKQADTGKVLCTIGVTCECDSWYMDLLRTQVRSSTQFHHV